MKKTNIGYVATWYGGAIALIVLLVAIAAITELYFIFAIVFVAIIAVMIILPGMMEKKMSKNALELEKDFTSRNFTYQYKFTSNSAVFYIDVGGRLGVIWKYNPTEFYLANLSGLTEVRVNDGKQLNGTSLVSCQFKLDGKKYKIYTLRVSNGQLSMKSDKVIEAISKAENLCDMLNKAKQNASSLA